MDSFENIKVIILAAGKGSRMQSSTPKVLHDLGGKPIIYHTLEHLKQFIPLENIYIVVSHQAELVKSTIEKAFKVNFVHQEAPLGTANAFDSALGQLGAGSSVLIINGDDSAFYTPETLQDYIQSHLKSQAVVSMLTLKKDSPVAKVFRDQDGNFLKILEREEYVDTDLQSDEINCGAYIFDVDWAKINMPKITLNSKGEYPITQFLTIAHAQGDKVNLYQLQKANEWVGINTQEELIQANIQLANV